MAPAPTLIYKNDAALVSHKLQYLHFQSPWIGDVCTESMVKAWKTLLQLQPKALGSGAARPDLNFTFLVVHFKSTLWIQLDSN